MNQGWRKDYLRYKSYFLNVMGRYQERTDLKVYLEILLSLITVSIFSIFALRPTLLTIAGLIKDIEAKRDVLSVMDEKISNLSKAQVLLDQKREEVRLLKTSIPTSPQPDVFARQIEGLSQKHSVVVARMSLGSSRIIDKSATDASSGQVSEIIYSLNFSVPIDNFTSISNLSLDLEKLRIPVTINKFNLNVSADTGVANLSTVIEGKLKYLKETKK